MAASGMTAAAIGRIDTQRAAELRRVKLVAALVLAASLALFVTARALSHLHPAFGFVAAFAEAATIGGLADWYAVVALFRKPLGLPIPHTAIIPANKDRIAEKLGEFIQTHFLDAAPVEAKLREVDFASFIADWLADRKRSTDLARFALRLLPEAVAATETSGLTSFLTRRVLGQLQGIDVTPVATAALRAFIRQGRHHVMLDRLLGVINETLTKPDTIAAIRDKVRDELPSLLKLYRADAFVVKRIISSATSFLDEVRADPKHPFRGEFDRLLVSFADQLERDPASAGRVAGLQRDLLSRPELGKLAGHMWSNAEIVHRAQRIGRKRGAAKPSRHHVHGSGPRTVSRHRDARRDQPRRRRRAAKLHRRTEGRRLDLHRRSGEVLGHHATHHPDRNQRRQGSAIHPLQRLPDRRAGGARAVHRGGRTCGCS